MFTNSYRPIPPHEDGIPPSPSASTSYGTSGLPPAYADSDIPDDFKYGTSVAAAAQDIRLAFVRKVYSILACQLGLTMALGALFMFNDGVKGWVQSNAWPMYTSLIATFVFLFALHWKRRSHPVNLYLLAAFTASEAYSIAVLVTFFDSIVVLQAVILTFALFVGLTLFTLQTKYDFSSWGPFLFGCLWVLVISGFIQLFFPFGSAANFAIAVGTALLFCGFICFDTQMILTRLSPEEYIVASVELYLDILNLFLAILRILNARND
ncbi:transmembrane BAX inhibitor motif-containing protein [Fimicolochytrium jonesii]|uniref:transmembrane BAX inhibitor motif-containing protein n=1 Tax=Fimicolochytrium jonesii TaxID=1396493 RepID=UPI0022FED63A|nr:transmembrane BAX inhibitor motif-containing protein [Fimicolochytrium jonesii]KAI8818771.1 transmembrane BAX inhibitor motif-containing protein [Fimicolochytrium jonesii]